MTTDSGTADVPDPEPTDDPELLKKINTFDTADAPRDPEDKFDPESWLAEKDGDDA